MSQAWAGKEIRQAMRSDRTIRLGWHNLRQGQRRAVETIVERYIAGEDFTSIVIPTRYGKSDVIRFAIVVLHLLGYPCGLLITQYITLREQFVRDKDWDDATARYGFPSVPTKELKNNRDCHKPDRNGEMLLVGTSSLMSSELALTYLVDWVEHTIAKDPHHPPIVFWDECHFGSDENAAGLAFKKLINAGARGTLLTATAKRTNGVNIPGFNVEIVKEEMTHYNTYRDTDDPSKLHVERFRATKTTKRLIPDHETKFRDAWNEGALCKIERLTCDPRLTGLKVEAKDEAQFISQISDQQLAGVALGEAVRDRQVQAQMLEMGLAALDGYRAIIAGSGMVVFTGNDKADEPGINQEAKKVERLLHAQRAGLRIGIATAAIDDDGRKGAEAREIIDDFKEGRYDVLIVKQMAALGFDCPRAKVLIDFSPTRTDIACIQRWTRVATPYEVDGKRIIVSTIVTIDDVMSRGIFADWVGAEGGEFVATTAEKIDEDFIDRKGPKEERPNPRVVEVRAGEMGDTDGITASGLFHPVVQALVAAEPLLINEATRPLLARAIVASGVTFVVPPPLKKPPSIVRTDNQEQDVRDEILKLAKDLAKAIQPYNKDNPAPYREALRQVWTAGFRAADLREEYQKEHHVPTLERLRDVYAQWLREGMVRDEVGVWLA